MDICIFRVQQVQRLQFQVRADRIFYIFIKNIGIAQVQLQTQTGSCMEIGLVLYKHRTNNI